MNFDKEGSKFEKKMFMCVCVWRGGGRGALTPNLYAKLFFFFFFFLIFVFFCLFVFFLIFEYLFFCSIFFFFNIF